MRALYFALCIVAITALPPRQYKKTTERKLELTTEAKLEPKEEKPEEETKEADEKEAPEKNKMPSVRAYYENQSINVVSSTSATVIDNQESQYLPPVKFAPEVNIGRPQMNANPVQSLQPQQYTQGNNNQKLEASAKKGSSSEAKKVYTVNVYVNFPSESDEHHDDDDCYKGKCWGKAKCKEGQVSVNGVCTDRQ